MATKENFDHDSIYLLGRIVDNDSNGHLLHFTSLITFTSREPNAPRVKSNHLPKGYVIPGLNRVNCNLPCATDSHNL